MLNCNQCIYCMFLKVTVACTLNRTQLPLFSIKFFLLNFGDLVRYASSLEYLENKRVPLDIHPVKFIHKKLCKKVIVFKIEIMTKNESMSCNGRKQLYLFHCDKRSEVKKLW